MLEKYYSKIVLTIGITYGIVILIAVALSMEN